MSRAPAPIMKINPGDLRQQAKKIKAERTDLLTDINNDLQALAGLGKFWGDDEVGQKFYSGVNGLPGYHFRRESAITDVHAIEMAYGKIAGGIEHMAANVDTANWGIRLSLPKVPK